MIWAAPPFEALRVTGAWVGCYKVNTFDYNGIVGRLPGCDDVFAACGFSGHCIQQALAVARAVAELVAARRICRRVPSDPHRRAGGHPECYPALRRLPIG